MNRLLSSLIFLASCVSGIHGHGAGPEEKTPAVSPLEQRFRDGLYAEEAKQDMAAAAQAYREIVANFDRDRETASSALFRLGEVYRKQNKAKEAAECFRRVAREFPDREPLARLARENLKALGEPLPEAPGGAAPQTDPEEDRALARLRQLEKDSPDLILKPGTDLKSTGFISYEEGAQAGYVRVVQWYLDHGASPDATPSGACPLTIAATFGHLPLVSFLLEKGASISGAKDGDYPLHSAAQKGHLAVAKLLLEKGADVNGRKYEHTEEGKKITGWTHTPLAAAADGGHRAMVEFLLAQKADPNGANQEALFAAADDGATDIVILLLKAGAAPREAMRLWRWREKQEIVTDPLTGNRRFAPPSGNTRKVKLRFEDEESPKGYAGVPTPHWENGGLAEKREYALLHFAVASGDARMVSALLEHKFPADAKSRLGSTPLELAILAGKPDIAQLLLKAGADANHAAPGGVRLIDFAIRRGDEKLYALLREHGAVVSGRSPGGASALGVLQDLKEHHMEFGKQHLIWLQRLLDDGADPNGDEAVRPVNVAASSGDLEMIRLLKAKGADFTPDKAAAPLPLAVQYEFTEKQLPVIKALLEAGADPGAISTAPPRVAYNTVQPRQPFEDANLLAAAAGHLPPVALLEKLLELKPPPGQACAAVQQSFYEARRNLDDLAKATVPSGQANGIGQASVQTVDAGKKELERVIAEAPAVFRRLWEYQWMECNDQIGKRVWFSMNDPDKSGMQKSFSPASPTGEPLSVVEALAWVYGASGMELKHDGYPWERWRAHPDLKNLVILRRDAATGKIKAREPVNLLVLAEKGDASALPLLQPGDLLEATAAPPDAAKEPPLISNTAKEPPPISNIPRPAFDYWTGFPEPILTFFRKVLLPRTVTVKAGGWERKFSFVPWHPQFRWDPASEILAVDPLLSQIVRYLPNPEYFYRMNAVRLIRPGQEPRTVDLSKPLTLETNVALRGGDRIEIEALPADDPALTARMKQGIFINWKAAGFLREVFHDPSTSPVTDDAALKLQILRRFLATSESLIPYLDAATVTFVRTTPDSVWGGRLEVSCGAATEGEWQLFDYQPAVRVKFTDGSASSAWDFWLGRSIFIRNGDFWTGGSDRLASSTLDELVRNVTSSNRTRTWGQWELLRDGEDKPLAVFTPGKDAIPQLFLNFGDTIKLSAEDAKAGWLPPKLQSTTEGGKPIWIYPGYGLLTSPTTPQPGRRRVTLPSQ